MNIDIAILLLLGAGFLFILITKALWQWILGTNVLIKEAKKQTALLREIKEGITNVQ